MFSKLSISPSEPSFLSSLKFTSCLGYGTFGIVLKAVENNASPSSTAMKFIFPTESSDKEQQQIVRECTLAKDFNHENLVKIQNIVGTRFNATELKGIFDTVATTDKGLVSLMGSYTSLATRYKTIESICIQMELCGENLRNWLNQKDLDKNSDKIQVLQINICHGMISGLKYLHDKKIIHRDLKPENIMFSREGFQLPVKIGDYGLCRFLHSSETQTSTLTSRTGTYEYMAPEAFTNDYSYQADLYSLGLVIWEVLQLIKFTERRSLFDSLVNDKEEDLVQSHNVVAGVRELVVKLTMRKKLNRTSSIDDIVVVFETYIKESERRTALVNDLLEKTVVSYKNKVDGLLGDIYLTADLQSVLDHEVQSAVNHLTHACQQYDGSASLVSIANVKIYPLLNVIMADFIAINTEKRKKVDPKISTITKNLIKEYDKQMEKFVALHSNSKSDLKHKFTAHHKKCQENIQEKFIQSLSPTITNANLKRHFLQIFNTEINSRLVFYVEKEKGLEKEIEVTTQKELAEEALVVENVLAKKPGTFYNQIMETYSRDITSFMTSTAEEEPSKAELEAYNGILEFEIEDQIRNECGVEEANQLIERFIKDSKFLLNHFRKNQEELALRNKGTSHKAESTSSSDICIPTPSSIAEKNTNPYSVYKVNLEEQRIQDARIKYLQYERHSIQKKTFTKWCNSFLVKYGMEIVDLFTDLADGCKLIKLLEIISGEDLGKTNNGKMRFHHVENVNKSLAFLHTKIRLESIGAEDIVDKNPRMILGLIWTIILRFQIQEIEIEVDEGSMGKKSEDALLRWCQRITNGYSNVNIQNFTGSWRSGLAFNALIHAHQPDLINFSQLVPQNHIDNLNNAFDTAEKALGITRLLDAEDVDIANPDEKSILMYVASFYRALSVGTPTEVHANAV